MVVEVETPPAASRSRWCAARCSSTTNRWRPTRARRPRGTHRNWCWDGTRVGWDHRRTQRIRRDRMIAGHVARLSRPADPMGMPVSQAIPTWPRCREAGSVDISWLTLAPRLVSHPPAASPLVTPAVARIAATPVTMSHGQLDRHLDTAPRGHRRHRRRRHRVPRHRRRAAPPRWCVRRASTAVRCASSCSSGTVSRIPIIRIGYPSAPRAPVQSLHFFWLSPVVNLAAFAHRGG